MSLLYNGNLPYPDIDPYPNAVAQVYCGAGEPGYINCPNAFDGAPLTMTDSVSIYYQVPIASPHVLDSSGVAPFTPQEALGPLSIDFLPYHMYNYIFNIKTMR